ncbi:MAG: hypothetical protein V1896_02350 [Candidatus Zambryskibacteria bacterium]
MRKGRQIKKTKKFFVAGALVVCFFGALILFFINSEKPVPHSNIIDTQISQYSDKNITQNAISTNLKFKDIAFDTLAPRAPSLFSNQIAAVARAVRFFTKTPSGGTKEYGSWVWTPIMQMTPKYVESILTDAERDGVNVIYVSVDSYLDIFVMPKGEARERQKEIFGNILEDFIVRAKYKGIAVDAEAGWRNWAEGDNVYKAFAVVNYVKNFNVTRENKFRGFQYDIEPYLLDSYKEDPASVLKNFVALVDSTESYLTDSDLKFSVVVPDFYDEKDKMTPKFSYNGIKTYTFKHLLNILDRREGSSIIVMSYRNFAEGEDGAIEISANEMQTAKRGAYKTKVIIAQETGDVPPPYITFYNTSKKYLSGEIQKINGVFDSHPNFGGIAIHYVNTFLALK